ncbi:hypothetical protein CJF31_00002800 [Rutstroemia sp. NJR-2017a BVV2]|nr:hypothetical protein CJF31_00002800 [Rutstroemia sp. NJR-2017a BVV2]
MGDLDGLVSKLLDVYTRSIKLLSAHRKINRKHERVSDEKDSQEASLLKSLRRSKSDVLQAYRQDLVQAGPRFSHGDGESFPTDIQDTSSHDLAAKARSSLSNILSRLDRAFMKAWESFSRGGRVRSSDREALTKLSNESRIQAINTFEELSKRLSHSTSSLANRHAVTRRGGKSRPHSTSSTKLTALGPATKEGWIRRKPLPRTASKRRQNCADTDRKQEVRHVFPICQHKAVSTPDVPHTWMAQYRTVDRSSQILTTPSSGEIPRRRVAQLLAAAGQSDLEHLEPTVLYPLAPYHQEPKPRSRFGRLFKSR